MIGTFSKINILILWNFYPMKQSNVSTGVTYWNYLKLAELLNLQGGIEGDESQLDPDELNFIVTHQVFELWFKLMGRELSLARDCLNAEWVAESSIPFVVHHLGRVNEILKVAVDHFRVTETITPQDFLKFRRKLGTSSGFQSYQLRCLELRLGLDAATRALWHRRNGGGGVDPVATLIAEAEAAGSNDPQGARVAETLRSAAREVSLRQALQRWLARTPINGIQASAPEAVEARETFLASHRVMLHAADPRLVPEFDRFAEAVELLAAPADVDPEETPRDRWRRIVAGLLYIETYRDRPLFAWPRLLIDRIVELEEHLVLWRTRHARMVERIIGRRPGTGGSSGVDYLDATACIRIFPELWAARGLLG